MGAESIVLCRFGVALAVVWGWKVLSPHPDVTAGAPLQQHPHLGGVRPARLHPGGIMLWSQSALWLSCQGEWVKCCVSPSVSLSGAGQLKNHYNSSAHAQEFGLNFEGLLVLLLSLFLLCVCLLHALGWGSIFKGNAGNWQSHNLFPSGKDHRDVLKWSDSLYLAGFCSGVLFIVCSVSQSSAQDCSLLHVF